MLSAADNALLTEVEGDAPLGNFFRRYWIPAAKSEEVPEAGGEPARVQLLGERLVAFRDPDGKLGLIGEFCPHRRASLAYARNEAGGLRCLYHGWKMAADGAVLETPAEPPESKLCEFVRHTSYPVREAGGLIWTYMGPAELEPPFPKFPWLDLPPSHLLVVKMYQDSNYLQGLEGDLDPAHPNFLHRDFAAADNESWSGAGWASMGAVMQNSVPQIHVEETPYLMHVGAVRATPDANINYVRLTEWVAPFYCYISTGPWESRLFKAWHPIDNERCFTFYIHYDPNKPLDIPAIHANWGHATTPPDYKTAHTRENMHLQDRHKMQTLNFSGVDGAAIQDRAMQEGMEPIVDRTKEHLGASDKAVVIYRRLILRALEAMAQGKPLPAQDPALSFAHRAASWYMPADKPWQDALIYQEDYERTHPLDPVRRSA
jgi:phthalate 4,5-dioxygenase oxygenase subunit